MSCPAVTGAVGSIRPAGLARRAGALSAGTELSASSDDGAGAGRKATSPLGFGAPPVPRSLSPTRIPIAEPRTTMMAMIGPTLRPRGGRTASGSGAARDGNGSGRCGSRCRGGSGRTGSLRTGSGLGTRSGVGAIISAGGGGVARPAGGLGGVGSGLSGATFDGVAVSRSSSSRMDLGGTTSGSAMLGAGGSGSSSCGGRAALYSPVANAK